MKVANELRELRDPRGGTGPEYFREVRKSSLRCWLDMRRQEIFDEQWIEGNG
jgi:hypothetical protein